MIFAIDIGNTNAKLAVFQDDTIIEQKTASLTSILKQLKQQKAEKIIVANVSAIPDEEIQHQIPSKNIIFVHHRLKLPFSIQYKTPETLGKDRISLVAGAIAKYPAESLLIIDMGSCITYDMVENKTNYTGGIISPGWKMRLAAMHNFTGNLPLLKPQMPSNIIGDNTETCMQAGAFYGIVEEINGIIDTIAQQKRGLKIIFTGGDHSFFVHHVKKPIFANPDLIFYGLLEIFKLNE